MAHPGYRPKFSDYHNHGNDRRNTERRYKEGKRVADPAQRRH